MKKLALIFMIVLLQSACAIAPKGKAVRYAADEGLFKGLDKNSKLSISFPSPHSGPYASVDQLNFQINKGEEKEKNASAIVGKSRKTGTWEVIEISTNENGKWVKLPKNE